MADDYVVATRDVFRDLIKKPKLQEKYLRKPPFRFIHDIVMNTMKATGFPNGLYQGPELNGKTIKVESAPHLRPHPLFTLNHQHRAR